MDFWRTAEIINKRKWFIMLSVIVATVMTFGATRLVGSKWTAAVQFVSPQAIAGGATQGGGQDDSSQQATIFTAIVKSKDVLEPSLRKLGLTQVPPDLLRNVTFVATAPRLFQLQVVDASPGRAESLANALADNFVIVYQNIRTKQAKLTLKLLETQLRAADARLTQARSKYDAYRYQHQIVGSLNTNLDFAMERLRDAMHKRNDVEIQLADAEARLPSVESQLATVPAVIKVPAPPDPQIPQMQETLTKLDQQLGDLRQHYTDAMPNVKRALAARDELAASLKAAQDKQAAATVDQPNAVHAALDQEARTLKQQIAGAKADMVALTAGVTSAQADIDKYKGIDTPLSTLAGDYATKMEDRNSLSGRLHNENLAYDSIVSQNPMAIMDPVNDFNPPINASQGHTLKLLLMAALAALIATSGLVIAMDSIDRRLKTVQQAEIILPAPVLAAIPQPMGQVTYATMARATELYPQSIHSEAYRFLGLHLLNPNATPVRSLMIVSAKAEQGSTTTLTNLGITLAQAGKKVILVDANTRTAELHHVFDMSNDFGYMDLLQTPTPEAVEQALHSTSIENLQVIPCGHQPNNPWQLFRSPNIFEVARQLREKADYVLYDTPSSIIFTDALNLAPVVDAAFLCVRALEAVTGAEQRLVRLMEEAKVPVLGCVLTDVPSAVVEGFENYMHYYKPAAAVESPVSAGASTPGNTEVTADHWIEMPKED